MKIIAIKKLTDYRFLNMYEATCEDGNGKAFPWFYTSRKQILSVGEDYRQADAVIIVPIHVDKEGTRRLVLIKEYRPPIQGYEVGFPAGLTDDKEQPSQTAVRELKEETGLETICVDKVSPTTFSSAGMTDESCRFVYLQCKGEVSSDFLEDNEDIDAQLLDYEQLFELFVDTASMFGSKAWAIIDGIIDRGHI